MPMGTTPGPRASSQPLQPPSSPPSLGSPNPSQPSTQNSAAGSSQRTHCFISSCSPGGGQQSYPSNQPTQAEHEGGTAVPRRSRGRRAQAGGQRLGHTCSSPPLRRARPGAPVWGSTWHTSGGWAAAGWPGGKKHNFSGAPADSPAPVPKG